MKFARLEIELLNVRCPECGERVPHPGMNSLCWTPLDVEHAAEEDNQDPATAPMCSACGAFVRIPRLKDIS